MELSEKRMWPEDISGWMIGVAGVLVGVLLFVGCKNPLVDYVATGNRAAGVEDAGPLWF